MGKKPKKEGAEPEQKDDSAREEQRRKKAVVELNGYRDLYPLFVEEIDCKARFDERTGQVFVEELVGRQGQMLEEAPEGQDLPG